MKTQSMLINTFIGITFVCTIFLIGWYSGKEGRELRLIDTAEAAGGKVKSPTGIAPDRYAYYPGTEELAKDEIRVIACGTGLPAARRGQAATCFLIEAGNGEKFLFDIETNDVDKNKG